ncbi:MAG: IS66 family insertion sequence element accessory protein TnpB [Lachnospiraceae bacterium]|jgi:transposase|nr:IS66 family insertion sequence element accessory protein TnpB [Lachnospiraceae bacterium]
MLKTASFSKIYICCGRTDLRKGIDGLSTIVKGQFQMDAFQEDVLFLFCGSKQDRFKALCWEGDGFVLMYKRIENGRLKWPRKREDACSISPEELHRLLDGLTILEEPSVRKAQCTEIS